MVHFYHFKFKSQREAQRISWDSPYIDVWNLKREIIQLAKLGDGYDFDLKIFDEGTNKELDDDLEMIPKDSTVLAQRTPAAVPGKGRASRYVSGKPPVTSKTGTAAASLKNNRMMDMENAQTEEEKLKAMFNLQQAQWQQKQEEMSHETRVPITGMKNMKKNNVPEGEPPHGYVCYRCGKKGHWIQACPTNDDATYDNKNRIKRTTGIPRSMLKKIEQEDVENLTEEQRQKLMVNAEGEYVFALADEKEWRKHLERVKATEKAKQEVKVGDKELQDRGLECPIDKRMFVDPMKTPCCGATYCHDCIENALIDNDLTCPGCQTENVSLERLEPDEGAKQKIKAYEAEKSEIKRRSRSPSAAVTPLAAAVSPADSRDGSKSPGGTSNKRKADEDPGEESPIAHDMKRQKSSDNRPNTANSEITPNAATTTTNMFPNMMPPDMSTMMQQMNFPNMGVAAMPFMPMMPGMMPNFMPNMMPNMNMNMNMTNFNPMMNGNMALPNTNQNFNNHHPNQNQFHHRGGGRGKFNQTHQPQRQQNNNSAMAGVPGVPTGPKSMQHQQSQVPSGPKFANQQRHLGKEEDQAYIRAPVNPGRYQNRRGRGTMRAADYRELGS